MPFFCVKSVKKTPNFRGKSVKIYTRQFFFTQTCLWCLWQIWGMTKTTYQWQRKRWRESLVLKARPCLRFHFHRGERKSRWYRRGRGAGRRWGWSIQWSRAPPSRKVLDWQIIRLKMMAIWLWTKEAHNCTYLEVAATAEVVEGWALAHYEDF